MTEDEARTLSTRIIDTWPNGPKQYIWQNELKPLHHPAATATFKELRKTSDRATTAQFHAIYNGIIRGLQSAAPPPARIDDGTPITRDEYLTRLANRADRGNPEARTELEMWGRYL